jgi:hypothetical protein
MERANIGGASNKKLDYLLHSQSIEHLILPDKSYR